MSEGRESVLEWWRRSRSSRFKEFNVERSMQARCAVLPYAVDSNLSLPDVCEFATGFVSERSEGRLCQVDGYYCSPEIFNDPDVFQSCDIRTEQLAKGQT